ncbi:MAG: IS1595 family transposase [Bryobacteraceae bacterium]|jgi:transposase-like protein
MEQHNPATLQEAIVYYSSPENCLNYLAAKRWPDGVVACPTCGSTSVSFLKNQLRWQCSSHHPKRQFSIKVGTIFEDSPIGLDKWLSAMWLITNAKNGISSWEIHRALGVSQKTAWFMLHRIRLSHQGKQGGKLSGHIEVDETFIGGKARNMHAAKRQNNSFKKAVVMGLLKRGGQVRATVIEDREKTTLQPIVEKHVRKGSNVYTDELVSYWGLDSKFVHQVINHAEAYVDGQIHTNGLENFWSLLKRSLKGTYVAVEPFHLFRYIDEQAFRYNNRKDMTDWDRFDLAVSQIVGRRLTYAELTGKVGETAVPF